MKKVLFILILIFIILGCNAQVIYKRDLTIDKTSPTITLSGSGATVSFNDGDVVLTQGANTITLTGGDFSLAGGYSLLLSGSLGSTTNRVVKGWFTDAEVTNAIAGSITGNAATVTGFTPAGGSITLSGADALTISTTANTSIVLPTSGTLASTAMVRDSVTTRAPEIVHDSITSRLANAIDIDDYLADYTGGAGGVDSISRLQFIVDVTTGAPEDGDSTITHTEWQGLDVNVYRDGLKQYSSVAYLDDYDHFRFASQTGTVTVHPSFVANEQIIIEAFEPIILKTLSIEGEESSLMDYTAYYSLDETSGTVAYDGAGSQNLTNYGATVNQTGASGKCYLFATNDYLGNVDAFEYTTALSISMMIKTNTTTGNESPVGNYHWTGEGYDFIRVATSGVMEFTVRNTVDGAGQVTGTTNVADNAWHHVVGTFDGTTVRLYIDGSEEGGGTAWAHAIVFNSLSRFCIGTRETGDNYFNGSIDEVVVYNRALSSDEVSALNANNGKPE